jgi:small subunit ribosomal protein S9
MAQKLKKKTTQIKKIVKKAKPVQTANQVAGAAGQKIFTIPKVRYIEAVGRRKVAIARARLYIEPGDFVVNDKVVGEYFADIPNASAKYHRPFQVTETVGKYAVTVKVKGSGKDAQLEAVQHALARALVKSNPDLKPLLKKAGLLTRDDRMKETRKIGTGGKARRQRQSPKR